MNSNNLSPFPIIDSHIHYVHPSHMPSLMDILDELKIDRSFVKDIPNNTDDAAIVGAMIAMAHGLGLGVVAEGIEKQEQLEFLRDQDCDEYQGYLASKPLLASDFLALVVKNMKKLAD